MQFKFYFLVLLMMVYQGFLTGAEKKLGKHIYVNAYKLNTTIKIDGMLNEPVYKNAPVTGFIQKEPSEGKKATESTNVWVAYDQSALYIGAKLFDSHPELIKGLLSRRDDINNSDWFMVFLDPYHDKRTGYEFGVNAAGSIFDGTMFNDSWDESSWNGIWDYAVKKESDGWSIEIRIPFTQLRFNDSDRMVWGINFLRKIQRKNENDYLIMVPKKESGFVSHFAQLTGLNGIKAQQRFEALPYLVSKAQYLVHNSNDPFYKGNQYKQTLGADFKIGLGSNLNLDATINPDFGQVEVDPAVVNLSDFETYYDEKRPFFIEGENIFMFGYSGSNNNWGFNWGNPEIFYSRRIGRSPQGSVNGNNQFVEKPHETRILGAGKITGKIGNDWSVGIINAVTARTFAQVYNSGKTTQQQVEPLTDYSVVRTQKEFNSGREGLGFIGTSTIRNLNTNEMKDILSDKAFVYGVDGWITLDDDETYVVNGYLSGSYSHGSKNYMVKLQESPLRYYQRPNAKFARLDSNRTSLSGYTARVALNKQKGNFYINSAVGIASPGYEANDAGFQFRADVINSHIVLGYRWYKPGDIFRSKSLYLAHYRNYNFDGNIIDLGFMLISNFEFLNYYGAQLNAGFNPETFSNRLTRGGPLAKSPASGFLNYDLYSDSRNKLVVDLSGESDFDKLGSQSNSISIDFTWKPNSQLNIIIGPSYSRNFQKLQWVGSFKDPSAVSTYKARYVFGEMNQNTISGNIRLNWTFTPALSLQVFLQPLISAGHYSNFKELKEPRSYETNFYGKQSSSIKYNDNNEEYVVDPDGSGPAPEFSFSNPDFNFKSLRGNVVLRWEFLPGSVFFLVWTHGQTNSDNPGDLSFGRDFKNLITSEANNIFLAKFTYWLNI